MRWAAAAALCLLTAAAAGCDPFDTTFDAVEPADLYEAEVKTAPPVSIDRLRVMTWNIKYAGGRIDFFYDCFGDRVLMSENEALANLAGLAAEINAVDPDVVILQEVDVESKRSAYVDEAQWLLDHTSLNYGAYASMWRADWVPSDGVGRVDTGNLVLSRWKFEDATRLALPLIGDQDPLERYFYLKRNILRVHAPVPGRDDLHIIVTHTSAYATDGTKKKQIDKYFQETNKIDDAAALLIGGGDFNTIPPDSVSTNDFPDEVCDDERFPPSDFSEQLEYMREVYDRYEPAIPLASYQADNAPYFTFTADKDGFWNRKLDYLFTNGTIVPGSASTYQDTMPLSDHAPISFEVAVP